MSQPLHPNTPSAPAHYSPSSHFNQLALPDEAVYRGDQGRSSSTSSHGHAPAGGHGQLRPLSTPYHSPPRAQPVAAPSTSSRSGYHPDNYNYNPEPSRGEATRGVYPHEAIPGAAAPYSFPPPLPPQQSYASGTASRVPASGYQYARPMISSYSNSGTVVPSGLVVPDQPSATTAKYECSYCGKGFTRPSSLKVCLLTVSSCLRKGILNLVPLFQIHVHSHTGERRKFRVYRLPPSSHQLTT